MVTESRQRGFAYLGLEEVKQMEVCREQIQILQEVPLGTAPEQQELCRNGAVSLARLEGLSALLQGHTALAAAGGEQGRVLRVGWAASHKPPGPTDPRSSGIPTAFVTEAP